MADLDVLALPSIEPESYGLVLVEALASGTPVVATDHGGPPEIVARADAGDRARRGARRRRLRSPLRSSTSSPSTRRRNAGGPACPRSPRRHHGFAEVFRAVAARSGR